MRALILAVMMGLAAPASAGVLPITGHYCYNAHDGTIGTMVDTDASGNASEPRPFSFTLVDSIAPPEPGEVGLVVTGQS